MLPMDFYRQEDADQNIYRYLSNFRGTSHFGIKQLADIAGYQEKDITQLKLRLGHALDRLEKKGFIEHWEPGKGLGRETTYHVVLSSRAMLKSQSCYT
jgi:DNA-binding MarR family transcriptional regulator